MSHLNHKSIIRIVYGFEDEITNLSQQYTHLRNCQICKQNVANEVAFEKFIRLNKENEVIDDSFTQTVMQKISLTQSQNLYRTRLLWGVFIFIKFALIILALSFVLIKANACAFILQWFAKNVSHNLFPAIYQIALTLEATFNMILISILTALIFKITCPKNLACN